MIWRFFKSALSAGFVKVKLLKVAGLHIPLFYHGRLIVIDCLYADLDDVIGCLHEFLDLVDLPIL
jgi:hypothetical protein